MGALTSNVECTEAYFVFVFIAALFWENVLIHSGKFRQFGPKDKTLVL